MSNDLCCARVTRWPAALVMPVVLMWSFAVAGLSSVSAAGDERYTPRSEHGTRHHEVGCIDYRSLLFVVGHTAGEDPEAARLLAMRDCRPLVPGASYTKCGEEGRAYPADGPPLTFTGYCRIGVADLRLYVLDILMEAQSPERQPR